MCDGERCLDVGRGCGRDEEKSGLGDTDWRGGTISRWHSLSPKFTPKPQLIPFSSWLPQPFLTFLLHIFISQKYNAALSTRLDQTCKTTPIFGYFSQQFASGWLANNQFTATVKSSIVSAIDSALHTSLRSRSCRKRRAPLNPLRRWRMLLTAGNNALDDDSRIQTTATTAKATRVVSRPQSSDLLFWMRCLVRNNSCRRLILSHRDSLLPLVALGTFTDPEGVRKHLLRLPSLFRRLLS